MPQFKIELRAGPRCSDGPYFCTHCNQLKQRIATDKLRQGKYVYVDETGRAWKSKRCPDCALAYKRARYKATYVPKRNGINPDVLAARLERQIAFAKFTNDLVQRSIRCVQWLETSYSDFGRRAGLLPSVAQHVSRWVRGNYHFGRPTCTKIEAYLIKWESGDDISI